MHREYKRAVVFPPEHEMSMEQRLNVEDIKIVRLAGLNHAYIM